MKNIPAKNIQRISSIMFVLLGIILTNTTIFAQDANASEKIQLMSEALYARDAGDLLLAKEKVDMLVALAPNDRNVQALLLSINESIEEKGLFVSDTASVLSVVEGDLPEVDSKNVTKAEGTTKAKDNTFLQIEEISPKYAAQKLIVEELLLIAESQLEAGDLAGASSTLFEIEARDPNSKDAKLLSIRISKAMEEVQGINLYKTRENMLNQVDNSWDRPKVFELENSVTAEKEEIPTLNIKLAQIKLPKINFTGMELTRVIENLSELSVEYDAAGEGVNIVPLFDPSLLNPQVNITLRNLSLDKILQFVTQQVNFTYQVGSDAVTIQPSDSIGGTSSTITEFFPISRATVIRLTGFRETTSSISDDPFADPLLAAGPSQDQEKDALQKFLQNAGVNFDGVTGSSLAFDGEQLIVTQTPRNIERLRTILKNYSEVKQVEIETKFLEVSQNDLDEFGFDWEFSPARTGGKDNYQVNANTRSLYDIGATTSGAKEARIGGINEDSQKPFDYFSPPVDIVPPQVGRALSFGDDPSESPSFIEDAFVLDDVNVDLTILALARKSGSDLMSAPKVTVLSGKRANIVVAQELRFPQSYGDIESTVSQGGSGGSAAVSITAGTPQDFTTRNVGVEMSVTPNVENDDTISLILEPKVTEFEGFVEYGGPSIALSPPSTTAIIPAGFYQPIFSTREITTEVNIYDGATVVMGGLTRDEVNSFDDKVPFLGDIPGLGRLFRSEGETRQKRNLLIFVTANLVSPGGSLSNQSYNNINPNTIYQTPSVTIPAGNNFRNITITE